MLDEQGLDLADFLPVAILGARAGDADLDVFERRLQPFRPKALFPFLDRQQGRPAGANPAVATQFAQRIGNIAFHHHRGIVPRLVSLPPRRCAQRVVFGMIASVPALDRHVDPAAHRQRIIEDGDLLVVAAPDRMCAVELEVDPAVARPTYEIPPHRSAHDELEYTEAPFQDPDFKCRSIAHQPRKEAPQARRIFVLVAALPPAATFGEMDTSVEVPSDQEDSVPGLQHRSLHCGEIIGRIDDDGSPLDLLITPDTRLDAIVQPSDLCRVLLVRIHTPRRAYSLASSFFSGVTSASAFSSSLRRSNTFSMCARSSSSR